MRATDIATALDNIARGFHDLAVAVATGGTPSPATARPAQGVTSSPTHAQAARTCRQCGQPLERKATKSGDPVLRCPEWRWNNGEANGHDSEFIK